MEISGNSFKVSQLQYIEDIEDQDLLLFSNNKLIFDDIESQKVSFSNMVKFLQQGLVNYKGFGTMLSENDLNYAVVGHLHSYNKVTAKTYYDYLDSGELTNLIGILKITDMHSEKQLSVWLPSINYDTKYKHIVGEMCLLASSSLKTEEEIERSIKVTATFNGWVYANGKTYTKYYGYYDFSEAYEYFNHSGDTFTVPDLRSFIRGNTTEFKDGYKKIEQYVILPYHDHSFGTEDFIQVELSDTVINSNYTFTGGLTQDTTSLTGNTIFINNTASKRKKDSNILSANMDFQIDVKLSKSYTKIGNSDVESEIYPSHIVLVPMVWIGKDIYR